MMEVAKPREMRQGMNKTTRKVANRKISQLNPSMTIGKIMKNMTTLTTRTRMMATKIGLSMETTNMRTSTKRTNMANGTTTHISRLQGKFP